VPCFSELHGASPAAQGIPWINMRQVEMIWSIAIEGAMTVRMEGAGFRVRAIAEVVGWG